MSCLVCRILDPLRVSRVSPTVCPRLIFFAVIYPCTSNAHESEIIPHDLTDVITTAMTCLTRSMNGLQSSAVPTISLSNCCILTSQWCYGFWVQPPNHQKHSLTAPEYFLYHTVTILIQKELISRCPASQISILETLTLKGSTLKGSATLYQPNSLKYSPPCFGWF